MPYCLHMTSLVKQKSSYKAFISLFYNVGPETLGVAFKTFEQLSGLWISVMHRIWRVWKAKGTLAFRHVYQL